MSVSRFSAQSLVRSAPRRGLFVLGLLMAVVAFVAVFVIGITLASRAGAGSKPVSIVVAAQDIQARQQLVATDAKLIQYPSAQVPAGAITSLAALKNQAALVPILAGQPITSNLISESAVPVPPTVNGFLPIPAGFVAVTIPTNEQEGVAGYIAVGDYINIIATVSTSEFGANGPAVKTVTRTVFNSVSVIRVGPAPTTAGAQAPQQQGVSSSLTVVMTLCDAQYLDWLIANASLKYALISYKDYAPASTTPDSSCPATSAPSGVGPSQVNSRWGFTSI